MLRAVDSENVNKDVMSGKKAAPIPDADLFFRMLGEKHIAEHAFTELYARYSWRVHAYCLRILGDRDEAMDLFQETFIRFYESAKKVEVMTNVPGFLIKIARNLCLNHRRNKKQTVDIAEIQAGLHSHSDEYPELLQLVTMALDMLSDEYREVFILREYQGLSYEEIADIVETSLPNVKIRIFRAKQRIRQILEPYLADIHS